MVKVEEAEYLVQRNTERLSSEYISIPHLLGRTVANNILSPIDMPGFNQSAMDGYALNYEESISSYELIGEIQAGDSDFLLLNPGQCVRIFTGAGVPDSANVVLQQEIVSVNGNVISTSSEVNVGKNIRIRGEQIRKGEVALKEGDLITAAGIGFVSGLGITEVEVYRKPLVSIVTTGNELVKPGDKLKSGQIYESNSFMLEAALNSYDYACNRKLSVEDNYEDTVYKIGKEISNSDVVIITGGISVGDYDYVKEALIELGVVELFYKVSQKPGKPLFFGKKDEKLIFALPGNPAAALTCFYMYILPCLNKLQGRDFVGLEKTKAKLSTNFNTKGSRSVFLKGNRDEELVHILGSQSSAMLDSFAVANCLIYLPEPLVPVSEGDLVTIYKLD